MCKPALLFTLLGMLLAATFSAPAVHAQSTEEQRARVERLEEQLRALPMRPAIREVSPHATDTTRAGALVVASERELTALARPAAEQAWPRLRRIFGRGADAVGHANAVFTLQHKFNDSTTPDLSLLVTRTSGGDRSTSWSNSASTSAASLARQIIWTAALNIESDFGLILDNAWPRQLAWSGFLDANSNANAVVALASWENADARACLRGQLASCGTLLSLDAPIILNQETGQEETRTQQSNVVRVAQDHLLAVVMKLGGASAPARFQQSGGHTIGERFMAAANVPIDSLLNTWRSDLTSQAALPTRHQRVQGLSALLVLTLVFLATTMRRPVVR